MPSALGLTIQIPGAGEEGQCTSDLDRLCQTSWSPVPLPPSPILPLCEELSKKYTGWAGDQEGRERIIQGPCQPPFTLPPPICLKETSVSRL